MQGSSLFRVGCRLNSDGVFSRLESIHKNKRPGKVESFAPPCDGINFFEVAAVNAELKDTTVVASSQKETNRGAFESISELCLRLRSN